LKLLVDQAENFDVAVIGAGPAGATAGRLLSQWGYSVLVLDKPQPAGLSLTESLPPSIRKLFDFLGILDRIEQKQFYRTTGNTVWWGRTEERVEKFAGPEAAGYQVLRGDFDRLLLELAEAAGATVCRKATVRKVDLDAAGCVRLDYEAIDGETIRVTSRFVLDCSGRAGVIARRGFRRKEQRYGTLAIAGVWRRESRWDLEDETHTLVETYRDGWAWSVPISPAVRYFTVMVDPRVTEIARRQRLEASYLAELEKTRQFRRTLDGANLQSPPWACDASLYTADRFAGPSFLLVGDAASFIEPLSSFGVKKALASAWVAAVVVNTCLKRPEMRDAALDFFSAQERKMYASSLAQSASYFREAGAQHAHPFWEKRAAVAADGRPGDADEEEWKREPEVRAAFEALKQSPAIRLRRAADVRTEKRPAIQGREVVMEDALVSPAMPSGVRFLDGVNLVRLVEIAGNYRDVPHMFEAYNRTAPPVGLPNFLGALSLLLAKRVLKNEVRGAIFPPGDGVVGR